MFDMKPHLREYKQPEKLSEYPQATCYEAGHLVTKNSGWRNKRPVINAEKCIGCTACARVCPVNCISGKVKEVHSIDQAKCIKCGACQETCKFKAIDKK